MNNKKVATVNISLSTMELTRSEILQMLSSNCLLCYNTRVGCLELFWLDIGVLGGAHKLALVIGAPVSDHDLGGVLVGHHHGWLWQSASESVGVIWLQWFLEHASVHVLSNLVLVLGQGRDLWKSLAVEVNWLWGTVAEGKAYGLSILLKNLAA